ncbi:DUF4178 domain-containing protein [Chitinimonas koreensis]|uniref:DUF4178 domain-containing protein n=1 Tax=Chitinimonas koreensis TaxID=356302 RepID=UPI00042344FF|nr:DUF4178 domain-containing protein [Chitinimonas koreensis]QNM95985.1 DUF4178 domain-containing protein [Chitinimonas koreensis]
MYAAPCTSCGAQVEFHSAASVMAVCAHCRSTLVRRDLDLEQLGTMAVLAEDRSPFRLRWRGHYRKVGFELIGRLQLRYAQGYWNEWYLRLDDGRLGWLSEGSGLCYLTFERTLKTVLPPIDAFAVGMQARLDGQAFEVTNIERAQCVAAEGELPFLARPGYEAPAVDLRADERFASLDYSETPPRCYLGEVVALESLLDRSAPNPPAMPRRVDARNFKCTACGAPLTVRSGEIHAVGCAHCGTVIDPDSPELAILDRARKALAQPLLPLGAQGRLLGRDYAVIGFLKRTTTIEDVRYGWDEYLLHGEEAGYAWLTCSDGHWSLARATSRQPRTERGNRSELHYLDRRYRHFQRCEAEVEQVIGEFTCQVRIGETVTVDDYVSPPYLLSCERSAQEQSWSLAEYLPAAAVAAAFKPPEPLPEPRGIAPNQPSPHSGSGRFWRAFAGFAVLALLLQIALVARTGQREIWRGSLTVPANAPRGQLQSPPFRLDGERNLAIEQDAGLDNRWLYTDLSLVHQQSGTRIGLGREMSYYHGVDEDGGWSEGERSDRALLTDLPAGDYLLEVEAETEPLPAEAVDRIRLVQDVPVWSNFWLLLGALALFPLAAWWRAARFEGRRWAESDYGGGD